MPTTMVNSSQEAKERGDECTKKQAAQANNNQQTWLEKTYLAAHQNHQNKEMI